MRENRSRLLFIVRNVADAKIAYTMQTAAERFVCLFEFARPLTESAIKQSAQIGVG